MRERLAQVHDSDGSEGDVPTLRSGHWVAEAPAGGAPSGAAGGDLSGTYPNPTIGSAGMEAIRDMLAAVITAGTNVSVTVSDGGDTITVASTAGYTDEQVRDVVAAALVAGTGMTVTINDGADTITLTSTGSYTDENARDAIAAMIAAGTHTGITFTYNDGADTLSATVTGGATTLDGLTDVDTSTVAPAEGTGLYYKASSSLWQVVPFDGRPIDNVPASPDAFDYEFNSPGNTLPSGYAWSNQGSATYREAGGFGSLYCPGQTYQLHDLIRAVPAGTAWQVTAKVTTPYGDGSVHVVQAGLVLADSSGTKRITMAKRGAYGDFTIGAHNNVSSFAASIGSVIYMPETCYIRITKNSGTSYDVHCSPDGVTWTAAVTAQNFTTHMATVDKIGFNIDPETTASLGRLLVHWIRKTA